MTLIQTIILLLYDRLNNLYLLMDYEEKCQLLLIGDSSVGKTSLIYRYTNQKNFHEHHLATVGIDYFSKDETINNRKIRVKLWDTAGQERYKSLTYSFFRNAQGVMLVYDVSNRDTFESLKYWMNSIKSTLGDESSIKIVIVGNKIDRQREVSKEEAEKFAKGINTEYFETSAKDNINVDQSIKHLVKCIVGDKKFAWERDSFKLGRKSLMDVKEEESKKCKC
jgi:small GTP-binding protein